jgi:FKBP-type peptidyl-prolyl cis-trans isomerase FklB
MSKVSTTLLALVAMVSMITVASAEQTKPASKPAKKADAKKPAKKADAKKPVKAAPKTVTTTVKKTVTKTVTVKKKINPNGKFSYAVGHDFGTRIGKMLGRGGITLDKESVLRGVQDGLKGKGPGQRVLRQWMMELRMKFRAHMMRNQRQQFSKNLIAGKLFLAKNAKKPGVKVLPSGLQYQVIKAGTGAKPKATDTVVTHYRGTLINGTVFDSSYKRGRPAKFPVNGVIKGWVEALQLMRVGAKWKLFIPQNLAYGARGAGPKIGPYSTLVFEIELIKIVKK